MLIVLDGFGLGDGGDHDATAIGHTPFFDRADEAYPRAILETSGPAVGLPPGQMGNSEVGHMTMGAGRVIDQDITRITREIEAGGLASNAVLAETVAAVRRTGGTIHLMGLLSDGGVHSHQDHLVALLEHFARENVPTAVHVFLDGRDTPPSSGAGYLRELMPHVEACGSHVATVSGRYFAMDRDDRWERVQRAYDAIVRREGTPAESAEAAVEAAYGRGETDEFVQPSVVAGGRALESGDAVLHFNFRADRARELTNVLVGAKPGRYDGHFERGDTPELAAFACFCEYDATFGLPVVFTSPTPERILGELLAESGRHQLRIAETEKYAHVTFFFNAGVEQPFPDEDRILVPSPRDVDTYDHKPEMAAEELSRRLVERLDETDYDFVLVNFANPDMVGHTGVLPAAVKAVETIDACLERVTAKILDLGGTALVTADHGNCELMVDPQTGEPHTAHTTNPVPVYWVTRDAAGRRLRDGSLADLAPTVLELLGLPAPNEMTGRSLIV
ncbi:MAG: 2,3-bisphosphoglycerate-independent phosphoglycerate mutase [Deltaproteobacteria bacterium]|nr:2,3-bisphosphoglycerate-independent phosphoglycerate mutase [Deltaproteobacteria bacterium]